MLLTARTALFIAKSLGAKEKGYSGEERMRHICRQIVGDNLKGEMALFPFLSLLVVRSLEELLWFAFQIFVPFRRESNVRSS